MWKVVGGVLAGVFVGAVVYEVSRRTGFGAALQDRARAAADAFQSGYQKRADGDELEAE